jgi:hypothetical protein
MNLDMLMKDPAFLKCVDTSAGKYHLISLNFCIC